MFFFIIIIIYFYGVYNFGTFGENVVGKIISIKIITSSFYQTILKKSNT